MVKLEEPDKGQAWVILIAVCLIRMIAVGLVRLRPLLYVAVIETYGVSRQEAAQPFAISTAIRNLGEAQKMKQRTSETFVKGLPESRPEENSKVHVQEYRVAKLPLYLCNSSLDELDKCSTDRSLEENISRKNSSETGGTISFQKAHSITIPTICGELEKKQSNINSSATCEKACEVSSVKKSSLLESVRGIATLYTNPAFVVISVFRAMITIVDISFVIVIVDYGKDKIIPESYGIYIINFLTAGDLIGRLCFGWVTDKKLLSISTYIAITYILQAVIIFLLPLVMNFYYFMLLMALYGTTFGTATAHLPFLILHYVDSNLQSVAMGCGGLLSGIVSFGVPIIVGYFRDDVGSYDGMFYMIGTIAVVAACFLSLIPQLVEFQRKKSERNKILQEELKMEDHYTRL